MLIERSIAATLVAVLMCKLFVHLSIIILSAFAATLGLVGGSFEAWGSAAGSLVYSFTAAGRPH